MSARRDEEPSAVTGPEPLAIGKLRGLQQMADDDGVFTMCAMDHRGSMRRLIRPGAPETVSDEELVEYKLDLTHGLAPYATAVLLDPVYGAAQAIASGVLPPRTALLVSLEETGYEEAPSGRVTTLLPDWSAGKIRRMGATAAKLLLYYRPDLEEAAARQRDVVRRVAEDCARADLPFLLEPIAYPVGEEERDPAVFAARKTGLVVRSARELTPLGIDVLKAEFPADLRYERDRGRLREACERLNEASRVPWILLSAGVGFREFAHQVEIACHAGASGSLGGRAIWEEAVRLPNARERDRWLSTVGADRLRELRAIVTHHAKPWWSKMPDRWRAEASVSPEWYRAYGTSRQDRTGAFRRLPVT